MKRFLHSSILALSLTGAFLINPGVVLADEPVISLRIPTGSPFSGVSSLTVAGVVSGAIRLLLVVAALLFFFMLVIGGIQWIVSGGDKAGSENARKRITSALVGLAIVFAAWAIVQLVNALFGVNIFELTIPSFVK